MSDKRNGDEYPQPLRIRGGRIVTESRVFDGEVLTACGKIWRLGTEAEPDLGTQVRELDASGAYVCPGFIDQHTHGAFGHRDFTPETLAALAGDLFKTGVTGFLITTVTMPHERLLAVLGSAAEAWGRDSGPMLGVHMEGPYINPKHAGAQNLKFVSLPDYSEMSELTAVEPGLIRIVTLAPELPGARAVIEALVQRRIIASMGHTDAAYDQAAAAFDAGVGCATHIFNAMRPIHHREPGPALAALDTGSVFVELICDGLHLHPAVVRTVVRSKGPDKVILVTDQIPAAGLPPGEYELGGIKVVTDGRASRTGAGNLAGSALTMNRAVFNVMEYAGVSLPEACRMASLNPARLLGLDRVKGSMAPGKDADIAVLEPDGAVRAVLHGGELVFTA